MKVLLVTKSLKKGGSSSGANNLASSLEAVGCEVFKLGAHESRNKLKLIRFMERVVERILFNSEVHFLKLAPATFNLKKLYETYRPDVIQLCDVSANTVSFKNLEDIPCPVVHRLSDFWPYHGISHYNTTPPRKFSLPDIILRKAMFDKGNTPEFIISPSYWLSECLSFKGLSKSKVRVIKNAVVIPSSSSNRMISSSVLNFGFISNCILDPRKGFSNLKVFLTSLSNEGRHVRVHIFGRIKTQEIPVIKNVEIINHGSFSKEDIDSVYNSFDILLCPSLLDNSPNVLCESLAHGRPVIAQSDTGMSTYLNERTGVLLDFRKATLENIRLFVDSCEKIISNYEQYSIESVNYCKEELSSKKIGKLYYDVYREAIVNS